MQTKTILTAHSGCEGTPDNSYMFLKHAFALAIESLEVDVMMNSQSILVLAHDDPETATATLDQAFDLLRQAPDKTLNCDLKMSGLELAVWELAQQHQVQQQLIFSGTVSMETWLHEDQMQKEARWYLNVELMIPNIYEQLRQLKPSKAEQQLALYMPRLVQAMDRSQASCLNMHFALYTPVIADLLTAAGVRVSLWTPNETDELTMLLQQNVFNVTTRQPSIAAQIRSNVTQEVSG